MISDIKYLKLILQLTADELSKYKTIPISAYDFMLDLALEIVFHMRHLLDDLKQNSFQKTETL